MKRILLTLSILGAAALSARAAVLLNEPFTYADGILTNVSSGTWTAHSGTGTGPIEVVSNKVFFTQAGAEDVNATIPGGPYASGNLYASFTVSFSALPLGTGGYFWHLKDTGTVNFRARLFATVTGASPGSFRVGIANGGNTPVVIANDLNLDTEYKLVVRYDTATAVATLWINPTSESSSVNQAVGTDSPSAVGITGVALRQSLSGGNGMGALTLDDLVIGTLFTDVQTAGGPPTISGIADQFIPANSNTGPLAFQVDDVETPVASLTVAATSSNPTLVPNNPSNLTLGGSGANRTLTVTPATSQQGVANVSVVVTDGDGFKATNTFSVTVGAPTISAVANQFTKINTATAPIAFVVGDTETAAGSLTVSGSSSNPTLVPNLPANFTFGGSGSNRTVVITPAAGQTGLATITLTVNDGTHNRTSEFVLSVSPQVGVDLSDSFNYTDGLVTDNSSFFWNRHSGSSGDSFVASGKLELSGARTDDVSAFLTNSPYAPESGMVLYSGFTVNFTELPTAGNGDYIAHFRDVGNTFRARVFATTNGAAAGKFRIGIANGGTSPTGTVAVDLDLNTTYQVATRYVAGTAESTLWVNPTSEASPSVSGTDFATTGTVWTYAFRQSSGIGALTVDDLRVSTSFPDVITLVPTVQPVITSVSVVGGNVRINFTAGAGDSTSAFTLQSAATVNGVYADVAATVTELAPGSFRAERALQGAQQFYKIKR